MNQECLVNVFQGKEGFVRTSLFLFKGSDLNMEKTFCCWLGKKWTKCAVL